MLIHIRLSTEEVMAIVFGAVIGLCLIWACLIWACLRNSSNADAADAERLVAPLKNSLIEPLYWENGMASSQHLPTSCY